MESIYWIDRLDHIHDLMQLIVLLLSMVFLLLSIIWFCTEEEKHLYRLLRFGLFWLLPAIIIGLLVKTFLPTTEEKYKELHEAVGAYGSPCVWQCRFDSCTATQEPGRGARTVMSAPQPFFTRQFSSSSVTDKSRTFVYHNIITTEYLPLCGFGGLFVNFKTQKI
ncbi:MAG: hypothetical protein IKP45_03145 [Bacteroidales bacterium]|nr:hypothetical protein [Bacteroidales bacterium]